MGQLNKDHFKDILKQVVDQVFEGKGNERHGHNKPFENQPWKHIADNVGEGFLLGQALKKIMELRSFDCADQKSVNAWKRDALGAIVYLTMAIMYKEYTELSKSKDKDVGSIPSS